MKLEINLSKFSTIGCSRLKFSCVAKIVFYSFIKKIVSIKTFNNTTKKIQELTFNYFVMLNRLFFINLSKV